MGCRESPERGVLCPPDRQLAIRKAVVSDGAEALVDEVTGEELLSSHTSIARGGVLNGRQAAHHDLVLAAPRLPDIRLIIRFGVRLDLEDIHRG